MVPDLADRSPLAAAHGLAPQLAPAGIFCRGDEALRVTSFNAASGVTLAIEGLQFVAGGNLIPFAHAHTPNTDRTTASTIARLGEGWLTSLHVRASGGAPRRGQCFVVVELVRGSVNGAVVPIAVLLQGYVTDTARRGWPSSPLELSPDGRGVIRSITGTDPAAGVEIAETVPTNARWRVLAVTAALVTDATAATRRAAIAFDDGAANLYLAQATAAHTASLGRTYSYPNSGSYVVAQTNLIGWPGPDAITLQGGSRIKTVTENLQAGDNWGAPQLLVEEWIED